MYISEDFPLNTGQILIPFIYSFCSLNTTNYRYFPLQGTQFGVALPLSITNLFSYYST
jgi:hypothetical protein